MPKPSNALIRRQLRQRRQALSNVSRLNAARNLAKVSRQCKPLLQARRVASYAPFNGELAPSFTSMPNCHDICLPRIDNYTRKLMRFYSARKSRKNRWGIVEPIPQSAPVLIRYFDVILLPLVAFDRMGNRLGMGAGYYDRALQATRHASIRRPFLIGVAYHFQEVNSLTAKPWDIRLDAILTDREYIVIGKSA